MNKSEKVTNLFPLNNDKHYHTLIYGVQNSGKTKKILIPLIKEEIRNNNRGITIFETNDEIYPELMKDESIDKSRILYLNTNDLAQDIRFNPLSGDENAVIKNMATLFNELDNLTKIDKQVLLMGIKLVKRLYDETATLIKLSQLIFNSGGIGRKMVMKFSRISASTEVEAKENADIASWFLNNYYSENSNSYNEATIVQSVMSLIFKDRGLSLFLNPDYTYEKKTCILDETEKGDMLLINNQYLLNLEEHIENKDVLIISTGNGSESYFNKFLNKLCILSFQSAINSLQHKGKGLTHSLYIDGLDSFESSIMMEMLQNSHKNKLAVYATICNRNTQNRDVKNLVDVMGSEIILSILDYNDALHYGNKFNILPFDLIYKDFKNAVVSLTTETGKCKPEIIKI